MRKKKQSTCSRTSSSLVALKLDGCINLTINPWDIGCTKCFVQKAFFPKHFNDHGQDAEVVLAVLLGSGCFSRGAVRKHLRGEFSQGGAERREH